MLKARGTSDLESSGGGSGARLRTGHHMDVTRAALGGSVQRGVGRSARKGERMLEACVNQRHREEVTDTRLF